MHIRRLQKFLFIETLKQTFLSRKLIPPPLHIDMKLPFPRDILFMLYYMIIVFWKRLPN